jgi:hypothetical protein
MALPKSLRAKDMRVAMSSDDFAVFRQKLILQAEFARETGPAADFIEDIYLHEPAKTVEPMMRLARAFAAYREATEKALAKVKK